MARSAVNHIKKRMGEIGSASADRISSGADYIKKVPGATTDFFVGPTTKNYIKNRASQIGSSSANAVKQAPGSTANYIKEAAGVRKGNVGSYVDAAPRLAGTVAADATIGAAKGFNKVLPMTRKTQENIGNLYTGRTEGPGMIAGAAVLGLGYSAFQTEKQTTFAHKLGQSSYVGAAPVMNSDGVGQVSNAPTLGASGGTVFGLHNARKG